MPLFEKFPVDKDVVGKLVKEHYNLQLGDLLKASQNHTFSATKIGNENNSSTNLPAEKFVVRATPDPTEKHYDRICDELFFCYYLANIAKVPGVCGPVLPLSNTEHSDITITKDGTNFSIKTPHAWAVRVDKLIVCVTTWAQGNPVDFMSYKWMTDANIIREWGSTFARIHNGSKQFSVDFPDISKRMRTWTDLHDNIMASTVESLHPDDSAVINNPQYYGILHGDLNVSNFHLAEIKPGTDTNAPEYQLYSFDWDQCQHGWWEYDLAQGALTTYMLKEAGSLPVGAEVVKEANPEYFDQMIIEGYELINGKNSVNRERYNRMVQLRKKFYGLFCSRAVIEGVPPEMGWFIDYCNVWINGKK